VARRYIASAPELRHQIVALGLGSLRRRIETELLPDNVIVRLDLDRVARRERDRRRGAALKVSRQSLAAANDVCGVVQPDAQAVFRRRRHQPRRPTLQLAITVPRAKAC
jgi:hypothetical protein